MTGRPTKAQTLTFRERVAAYFRSKPNTWIDGNELSEIGGCYAWRSRVSDCRTVMGMNIENRLTHRPNGQIRSEYRFVPAEKPAQADLLTGGA